MYINISYGRITSFSQFNMVNLKICKSWSHRQTSPLVNHVTTEVLIIIYMSSAEI